MAPQTLLQERDIYPDSSPDPLASSLGRRPTPRKPLQRTSSNHAKARLSSPVKTVHSTDHSATFEVSPSKSTSPWKIKVTVEQNGDGIVDQENIDLESPTRRVKQRTTTKTTTVPLKGADETSPVKRRGRPRKSDTGAASKPRRDVTPAGKSSKGRKSAETAESSILDVSGLDSEPAPTKRPRGRPRKNIATPNQPQGRNMKEGQSSHENQLQNLDGNATKIAPVDPSSSPSSLPGRCDTPAEDVSPVKPSEPKGVPGKGRDGNESSRKTTHQVETSTYTHLQRASSTGVKKIDFANVTPLHLKYSRQIGDNTTPEINPIHFRVPTPRKPIGYDESAESPMPQSSPMHSFPVNPDASIIAPKITRFDKRNYPALSTAPEVVRRDNQEHGIDDGIDSTTIMESEGFSMISVDSLPSRQLSSSPSAATSNLPSIASVSSNPKLKAAPSPRVLSYLKVKHSHMPSSPPGAPLSYRTPSLEAVSPSGPPPIEPALLFPRTASTPRLSGVVKTAIALQGVVDVNENKVTGDKSPLATKARLDSLFSGFGEGTRRELQAGLRLGEELARRSQERNMSRSVSPEMGACGSGDDVFKIHRNAAGEPNSQRLPTPEEQCQSHSRAVKPPFSLPVPRRQVQDVTIRYPSLNGNQLSLQIATPEIGSEMDWQPTTPLSSAGTDTESPYQNKDDNREANDTQVSQHVDDRAQDISDIWEEEASRSSDIEILDKTQPSLVPQVADLFVDDESLAKPKRSKLPKTWRRKSNSDFNYSDEAEPSTQTIPTDTRLPAEVNAVSVTVSEESTATLPDRMDNVSYPDIEDDDTGLFWQHDYTVHNIPRRNRRKRGDSEKLDLTELLGLNKNTLNSSPIREPQRLTPFRSPAPILKITRDSSPARPRDSASSPSKHVSFADATFDDSIDDSDPIVDQYVSEASDAQQLQDELEARSNSQPFYRDMQSSQPLEDAVSQCSSPAFRTRMSCSVLTVDPNCVVNPLFEKSSVAAPVVPSPVERQYTSASSEVVAEDIEIKTTGPGLFSRFTGGIWSAITRTPPPPQHPVLRPYPPIPSEYPWTRTHFISLDNLYQAQKRDPSVFSPKSHPTNAALLSTFSNRSKYVGAIISNWGYSLEFTEDHLVMAKVLMQTMTVKDVAEYEQVTGKKAKIGNCNVGGPESGRISEEDVMIKIFAIIAGEMIRDDEDQGKKIDRTGTLTIEWNV
ncbi:hypothetical protein EJ05DRAFT_351944 [Pseudovirgaria hyperparasitica]|uniref:Uncharacterized protein n=1 Tax=Pseudovirgaria hyperparasitica TaxID=470096 RepID=A0A6A6WBH7_9PEZI|nr:uncharacterized protein EJ05DRAFT_351944 [Pseudovirgaria hyperparasitica]KAF2758461.1 hypothetical protein EJ05DRAFT_351944 [Pseudovirgaria hyperparasitica]